MKSEFRPTSAADAAGLRAFFVHVHGASELLPLDDDTMAWKYWSPHPLWEGSRSYVLERDRQIVAHGAVVPASCVCGGERFRAFHLIDWVASPTAQGAGVSLYRRVLQLADAACAVGGSEDTQRILPVFGFREAGIATRFVRPLRPLTRFTAAPAKTWRILAQAARSALWRFQAPPARAHGWTVAALSPGELAGFRWPHPEAGAYFERTAELFTWLLQCPVASFRLYAVARGAIRGYFVLVFAAAQVRVADCGVDSGDPDDWRDLYLLAAANAWSDSNAAEVVTVASDDRSRAALTRAGFHPRGDEPIRYFSRTHRIESLRLQMIDSDAAYLAARHKEFWA